MAIRTLDGRVPKIAESAFVSEAAYLVGDVEIAEGSSVWPGAVLRADFGKIRIGKHTAVEDNCVIHSGTPSAPIGDVTIGDRVIVGHGAVLNCLNVGNNVLIGMNATILHDVSIGNNCVIAAGSVIPPGSRIPDGSFVAGVPGKIVGEPTESQLWWTREGPEGYFKLMQLYRKQGL